MLDSAAVHGRMSSVGSFREFAVTLAVTIVISAVVSLTLTPMMCSRILRHNPQGSRDGSISVGARFRAHDRVLWGNTEVGSGYQTITLFVALGTLVLTIFLYIVIPKGFFPVQDTGRDPGNFAGAAEISFPAMARSSNELAQDHPAGPRGGKSVLVYRRGWHEHHAEQRPDVHQP